MLYLFCDHFITLLKGVSSLKELFICCILYTVHDGSVCLVQLSHPTGNCLAKFLPLIAALPLHLLFMAARLLWLSTKDRPWTAWKASAWYEEMWAITTLPATCCVSVSKLSYILEVQFTHVENEVIKLFYMFYMTNQYNEYIF